MCVCNMMSYCTWYLVLDYVVSSIRPSIDSMEREPWIHEECVRVSLSASTPLSLNGRGVGRREEAVSVWRGRTRIEA